MSHTPIIRSLDVKPRIIDAQRGLVDYVASDASLDSYQEIVDPRGWRFSRFEKNAPFVDSHDYGCIDKLLGKVVDFRVEGGALVERVQWAMECADHNPLIALGWKLTETGYLRAVSVGFIPVRHASKWDGNGTELANAAAELKLDAATAAKVRVIYLEQEQIELSACIIGANPNALAKAHAEGAIRDGDLAACGFGDEDFAALRDMAGAIDGCEQPAARRFIATMWRHYAATLSTRKSTQPASPAPGGAVADEARQHRRAKLLAELRNATNQLKKPIK